MFPMVSKLVLNHLEGIRAGARTWNTICQAQQGFLRLLPRVSLESCWHYYSFGDGTRQYCTRCYRSRIQDFLQICTPWATSLKIQIIMEKRFWKPTLILSHHAELFPCLILLITLHRLTCFEKVCYYKNEALRLQLKFVCVKKWTYFTTLYFL